MGIAPIGNIRGTLSGGAIVRGELKSASRVVAKIASVGRLKGNLSATASVRGTLACGNRVMGKLTIPYSSSEEYKGDVEVVPGEDEQILQTGGMMVRNNIVVKPIPSNYGLITWDGAKLTVS